jgi:hypothetical protein
MGELSEDIMAVKGEKKGRGGGSKGRCQWDSESDTSIKFSNT